MSDQPAGYYYAEGDPPGTVRYWDGTQWVGEPKPPENVQPPAPPGAPVAPPPPAMADDTGRFATLGVRLGASVIDMVVAIGILFVILAIFFGESDGNGGFEANTGTGGTIVITAIVTVFFIAMIALAGGTPGKLMTGLRVTQEDGTTPVGWRGATLRSLPYIIGIIPLLGAVVVIGCIIAAMVMIGGSDPERQSVYDKMGSTRVVHKRSL